MGLRLVLALVGACAFALSAEAATYYVDWTAGNDANNGASTSTPWKRAPGMRNFAGSYAHTAGDRFIFKGGVTWPIAAFQGGSVSAPAGGMKISIGGSSDSVRDYYGATNTWFSGASFSRPIFDFENTSVGTWGGWRDAAGILIINTAYVTIDNLEIKRHRSALKPADWGNCTINIDNSNYVTVRNCLIRDWSVPAFTEANSTGGGEGGVFATNGGGTGIIVEGCEFSQVNSSNRGGRSISVGGIIRSNIIHHTSTAIMGAGTINDNHIYDIIQATDPAAHQNAIYTFSPSTIYNNVIHDVVAGCTVIYTSPGFNGQNGTDLIYNNVVYNTGKIPIEVDQESGDPTLCGSIIYNNTLVGPGGSGSCIRIGYRFANWGSLDARNNHLITSGAPFCYNNQAGGCANVNSVTLANNLTQTVAQATSAGYIVGNQFQPTDAADPTVGVGVNLSATFSIDVLNNSRSVPWDIGAYEWSGTPSAGNLAFQSSTYSTAEDTTLVVTVSRTGGTSGTVGATWQLDDGTALAATDYTDAGTTVSLGNGVTSVTFNVTILRNVAFTGNRYFTATLSNPTGNADLVSPTVTTITITDSDSSPDPIPTFTQAGGDINIPARLMLVLEPFAIQNNVAVQSIETVTTNNAGQLQAYCVITNVGVVTFEWELFGDFPHGGANSGFLRINGTNDVSHVVTLTSGFEARKGTWQGSGTFDEPQFNPLRLQMSGPSTNLLVWYGREICTISNITWKFQSTPPPPPQQLSFASSTAWTFNSGGSVQVNVSRVGTSGIVEVDYATADGTAVAATDYTATSGTLTFADGVVSQTITILVVNHPTWVGNKIFTVSLSNPIGADLSPPTLCSVALLDDLTPPLPDIFNTGFLEIKGTITIKGEMRTK